MATNEQDAEQAASDIEIEWQFDALDLRPIERWLAALPARASELRQAGQATSLPAIALSQGSEDSSDAPADGAVTALTALAKPSRRLVDRYLDTDDWRVARAGYVLRTRRHGRHDEATLKSLKPASTAGLRQRQELTELLPSGDIEQLSSDGPVGGRVGAMAGKKSLRQVLEVRTRRRPFSLRIGTQEVAELALDDTTIVGGDEAPVRLRRVEVEVDPAWITGLEPIVDDLVAACGLRVATLSKFEAGLLGLGLGLPGAPDLGPTTVTPSSTMAEAAFAVIRRHIRQLILREPGTRLGEDVEELHDMRVATRRIRAALDLFQDVLPVRAQTSRQELGWLGSVLGEVRDLDVQLERHVTDRAQVAELLGPVAARELEPLRELLLAERHEARGRMLVALDSERYEQLVDGLESLARSGSARRVPLSRTPAAVAMPELVDQRHRAATKAARRARRTGEAADYHRLRIRCKRLRYCLEFARDVMSGRTDRYVRHLTKLQDTLGRLQDDETAVDQLHKLATSRDPALPPETVYVMGAMAAHYRGDASGLLKRARKRVDVLKGEEWQELTRYMERRRHEATAHGPAHLATHGTDAQGAGSLASAPTPVAPGAPSTPPPPGAAAPAAADAPAPAGASPVPSTTSPDDPGAGLVAAGAPTSGAQEAPDPVPPADEAPSAELGPYDPGSSRRDGSNGVGEP